MTAGLVFGQAPSTSPSILPVAPERVYTELKAYLGLTDAQVDQLTRLQAAYYQSNQALNTEIGNKYRVLYAEMESNTPNAAVAGEAVVAIANLRRQLTAAEKRVQLDAAALLTDVQKPKLQALDAARKLQIPISQAQSLFLLEGSFYGLLAAESGIGKMPMLP